MVGESVQGDRSVRALSEYTDYSGLSEPIQTNADQIGHRSKRKSVTMAFIGHHGFRSKSTDRKSKVEDNVLLPHEKEDNTLPTKQEDIEDEYIEEEIEVEEEVEEEVSEEISEVESEIGMEDYIQDEQGTVSEVKMERVSAATKGERSLSIKSSQDLLTTEILTTLGEKKKGSIFRETDDESIPEELSAEGEEEFEEGFETSGEGTSTGELEQYHDEEEKEWKRTTKKKKIKKLVKVKKIIKKYVKRPTGK